MWIKICGNTTLEDAQLAADLGADAVGFVFAPSARRVTPEQVAAITPHLPASVERIGVFHESDPTCIVAIARQAGLTAVQLHGTPSQDNQAAQESQTSTDSPCEPQAPPNLQPARPLAIDTFTPARTSTDNTVDLASTSTPDTFSLARALTAQLPSGIAIIQTIHWTVPHPAVLTSKATQAQQLLEHLVSLSTIPSVNRVVIDSKVGAALGGTGTPFDWTSARDVFHSSPAGLHLILAGGLSPENVTQAINLLHPWGIDAVTGIEATPGRKDPKKLVAFLKNARA